MKDLYEEVIEKPKVGFNGEFGMGEPEVHVWSPSYTKPRIVREVYFHGPLGECTLTREQYESLP